MAFESPPPDALPRASRDVYSVTRLNREVGALLQAGFPSLWIEAEISNLRRPGSGHLYFSLKDEESQVRAVLWRSTALGLGFRPADGVTVLCRARVALYEPRGEYQLVVEHMEEAGEGRLRREFEALKRKLQAEGLFDAARKRALPALPRRIGVVTSPSGAALRDILHVLARRFPAVPVLVYPAQVQGEAAPADIATALAAAGRRAECDVLILARGGGSLEDLHAFNTEEVARAIAGCPIPVVAGVGHETDFTIADFVADLRAPTPSAAAEHVVPDRGEWLRTLSGLAGRLGQRVRRRLVEAERRREWAARRVWQLHPGRRLEQQSQRVDELEQRLGRAASRRLEGLAQRLARGRDRLAAASPAPRLAAGRAGVETATRALGRAMTDRFRALRGRLELAGRALATVSPEATLTRGYAIATRADGGILRDATGVRRGERLGLRVARGEVEVEAVEDGRPGTGHGAAQERSK